MNFFLVLSNISIGILWLACQFITIPYVINLLGIVTTTIYSACHYSLILRREHALSRGEVDPNKRDDEVELPPISDTLTKEDAIKFPFIGSATLFSLYIAFKLFDVNTVNLIFSGYFGLLGCAAVTSVATNVISLLGGPFTSLKLKKEIKIAHCLPAFIGGHSPWDLSIDASLSDILSFIGSAIFACFYLHTRHWAMNNVIGICFCLKAIDRFSLGTYKTGAILLAGLFFYDVFWVFGTNVMVTVAKSVDGPIKILFPRTLVPDVVTGKHDLALLGLGDIVLPGFFLALLLRFDAHNAKVPYFPVNIHAKFAKPYFHSALVGYVMGMSLTMFIMMKFKAAQPALLYLVPSCLGSSFLTAVIKGEVKALFEYTEEVENNEAIMEKEKEEAAKKKD